MQIYKHSVINIRNNYRIYLMLNEKHQQRRHRYICNNKNVHSYTSSWRTGGSVGKLWNSSSGWIINDLITEPVCSLQCAQFEKQQTIWKSVGNCCGLVVVVRMHAIAAAGHPPGLYGATNTSPMAVFNFQSFCALLHVNYTLRLDFITFSIALTIVI